MRSKKQHIRLWFECLQICHSQSEYSDDLIQSSEFYDEWGNITHIKFDDWWKEKQYLFDESGEIITNSVGTPELLNYYYYFPDLSEINTYVVILAFLLGAALLFLLDYYDKKRKS